MINIDKKTTLIALDAFRIIIADKDKITTRTYYEMDYKNAFKEITEATTISELLPSSPFN